MIYTFVKIFSAIKSSRFLVHALVQIKVEGFTMLRDRSQAKGHSITCSNLYEMSRTDKSTGKA